MGLGRASHLEDDCLLDTGGLVDGWSYMSEETLAKISPENFEEIKLPDAQLRGVGVLQQPILFTKSVVLPIFLEGCLAAKPTEKRVLKKNIIFRITARKNIHHNMVLNSGDCANVLGLTLQLPLKIAWWSDQDARSSRRKVVPNILASISASIAESQL